MTNYCTGYNSDITGKYRWCLRGIRCGGILYTQN